MNRRARIAVVDDSAVARTVVSQALETASDLTVVATARNGVDALEKVRATLPDAVTLDIEMPEMDGIECLRHLKREFPRMPVVMVSCLTHRGAQATVEALLAGADGYVAKPSQSNRSEAVQAIVDELLPKLRALVWRDAATPRPERGASGSAVPRTSAAPPLVLSRREGVLKPSLLAIASSTGGPAALRDVLKGLPDGFPLPIVIAQHMPTMFTAMLAQRLTSETQFDVREGSEGESLRPGHVWIAPGDYHMSLRGVKGNATLVLDQSEPVNSCRPSADVLFGSIAKSHGAEALAVVLTGMGQDGLDGCRAIDGVGGQIAVQDEATSVVWGMPGFVARNGLAGAVVPLSEMASVIADCALTGQLGPKHRSEQPRVD